MSNTREDPAPKMKRPDERDCETYDPQWWSDDWTNENWRGLIDTKRLRAVLDEALVEVTDLELSPGARVFRATQALGISDVLFAAADRARANVRTADEFDRYGDVLAAISDGTSKRGVTCTMMSMASGEFGIGTFSVGDRGYLFYDDHDDTCFCLLLGTWEKVRVS